MSNQAFREDVMEEEEEAVARKVNMLEVSCYIASSLFYYLKFKIFRTFNILI